jgi:hypothetical protein
MRLVLSAAYWAVIVGGVALFIAQRDARRAAPVYVAEEAKGIFALDAVVSFSAEPDPFALDTGGAKAAGLVVRLNGRDVLREEKLKAGVAARAEAVTGVVVGKNELFVEANPPTDQLDRAHAVRVRVLRDGVPVAEATVWSEPGMPVAAPVSLDVPKAGSR